MMQEQDTTEWAGLVPKATKAHNKLSHEALMGNADPDESYGMHQTNLHFELREEAGKHGTAECNNRYQPKECTGKWRRSNLYWEGIHQEEGR